MFASRFKRWLLAERIEQLQGSYEPGRTEHQQPKGELVKEATMTQEPVVAARGGVIRRAEIPLLARYGTSYAPFDGWIADYESASSSATPTAWVNTWATTCGSPDR